MADDSGEKTEEATEARREEFRKQGNVAQTRELASAVLLLATAGGVYVLGRFFFQNLLEVFQLAYGPGLLSSIRETESTKDLFMFCAQKIFILVMPIVGFTTLLGVAASIVQVGFLQVEDALTPKFDKINPLEGAKKLISLRTLMEGLKSFFKMGVIGVVLYFLIKGEVKNIPFIMHMSVPEIAAYIGTVASKLLGGVGFSLLVIAGADYFYQRMDIEKKMMMTKQEVKEEHKQREGDPMIKSRIRRIQREMASKRMMSEVPKADVIITNPTHIAVALKYSDNMPAPMVIAMGADLIAEKIKDLARENKIPILENKPLARTIFKTMKIGQVIPRELFVAVAEVLSFVYKLRKKKRI